MTADGSLGPLLQSFFMQHLLTYRRSSPQTVAAYRDTFCLLLRFLKQRHGREPSLLRPEDIDAAAVLAFLDYLETDRKNSVRSRNARLAAIRSFFRFVALREPERLALVNQVLASASSVLSSQSRTTRCSYSRSTPWKTCPRCQSLVWRIRKAIGWHHTAETGTVSGIGWEMWKALRSPHRGSSVRPNFETQPGIVRLPASPWTCAPSVARKTRNRFDGNSSTPNVAGR